MISVVIPAFNEEGAIGNTINEVIKVFKDANITPYEVVIVNDGSTDNTAAEALASGATVISNPHNMGYGYSLKRGITIAKYDTIAITDADMTYPFEYIPEFIKEKERGVDLVIGERTGKHYRESFFKAILRRILKFFVEFTADRRINDINSGLRVFSRITVMEYFDRLCDTFSFSTSQTLAYMMNSKFVTYIPIPYNKRKGKSKVKLFKDSVRTLQYIVEASVYYNPLKIFTLFSFVCIFLSVIGFIVSTTRGIQAGYLLGIGGMIVALFFIGIGLLAVLLKKIMDRSGGQNGKTNK